MWTLRGALRWRWRDLPIRQKGLVVIAAPIVPLLATTILLGLVLVGEEQVDAAAQARAHRMTLWLTCGGAALGLVGGVAGMLVFTRDISDGVERLQTNADRLLSGEPLLPVSPGDDELKRAKRRLVDVAVELTRRDHALRDHAGQVDAANRELEAFSYSVSHDLRAPLRHVVGFSGLLEQHAVASLDETGRRYISVIKDAASRMGALIDDLLSFSRMGRTEMIHIEVDLNALVADVLIEAGNFAPSRQVTWTIHPLPRVRGDRAMLRVALVNLISNALKYTGPRPLPEIEIGAGTADDGGVVVYVKDNGVGFDMTYADKLFGVFQRLHSTEQFDGTGIGLANVRRIVQRHGGRAWAEGQPDAGATFYLSLPAA